MLDLDATDDPLHGAQEGRFFHGYYGCYCYLPLYVFCGDHLLVAKLRRSNIDASAGAVEEVARLVAQIRARWPQVRIILRADSGFARDGLMVWAESTGSTMSSAWPATPRLVGEIAAELALAKAEAEQTGKAARCFKDFRYQTLDSWSCERRVVGKAEQLVGGDGETSPNPRFVVTSSAAEAWAAQAALRAALLRPRRDGKPDQGMPARPVRRPHLHRAMRANQLRLWFAVDGLRAAGGAAADRPAGDPAGPGHGRHDPPQAAQDRRAGARLGPPGHGRDGLRPPLAARLGHRPPGPRPRRQADHDPDSAQSTSPDATLPAGGTGPCCPTPTATRPPRPNPPPQPRHTDPPPKLAAVRNPG